MKTKSLSQNDREFFTLVSKATFTNPFSQRRLEIDRIISGDKTNRPWVGVRPEAIREVNRRIGQLEKNNPVAIQDFKKADQRLMENVFLFDEYHKGNESFDRFIVQQAKTDSEPLKVPFAREAIGRLIARGIDADQAKRYFSLFYQIRRAFYFIAGGLIGQSPSMKKLRENLWNNIFTYDIDQYQLYLWDRMEDFSTLLLGPTGCGKGTAAAAIGRSGFIPYDDKKNAFARSFTQTFVSVNLSQFVETLLESELFGHARGAFTGAVESHDGLFARCGEHGAIFLDEIGDISGQVQLKLLKVLEERVFSPVGSHKKLRFGGRVIAATNIDMDELRRQKKFRDDFYYRLCSDCIVVPGLRQRIGENPNELNELIAHTARLITGKDSEDLIGMVIEVIAKRLGPDYHWPGNVRELAQCIRRVIIKHDYQGDTVGASTQQDPTLTELIEQGSLDAQQLLTQYCTALHRKHGTFEKVAQITKLDRRTVKKYIQNAPHAAVEYIAPYSPSRSLTVQGEFDKIIDIGKTDYGFHLDGKCQFGVMKRRKTAAVVAHAMYSKRFFTGGLQMLPNKQTKLKPAILLIAAALCMAAVSYAAPMGTAFTYQGRLADDNNPADGLYDFEFAVFDALGGGTQQGSTVSKDDKDVIDGYFTVPLDFGGDPNIFNGDARWLEIAVRPGASTGQFTTLSPRQELTPVPYAMQTRGIFVDDNGNVGIGTTSPDEKLSVAGTIESTSGGVKFPDGTVQTTSAAELSALIASLQARIAALENPPRWFTAVPIETDTGFASSPQVAINPNGNAVAVWRQHDGTRYNIWSNRYGALTGWGTAELIETDNAGDAETPQVAVDASGNAVAVWYQWEWDGTRYNIWSNRYVAGTGWGTAELIETDTGSAGFPQVAIDPIGKAVAVWMQYDGTRQNIWSNRYVAGTGWGTAELIETDNAGHASYPQVAIDPNGNAVAVWQQYDGTRDNIWSNRYVAGTGWGTAELIETGTVSTEYPQVAIDSNGNAVAVWTQDSGFSISSIWSNRYVAGTGWGTAELIKTDNTGNTDSPQVAVDASGNAVAVWRQHDGTRYNIWSNRYVALTGWGTAELIETDTGVVHTPQVAIDPSGNAIAVWRQHDGVRYSIYTNRYVVGPGWGRWTELIETYNVGNAYSPQVAVDASGNAVAVWLQGSFSIWSNRYE